MITPFSGLFLARAVFYATEVPLFGALVFIAYIAPARLGCVLANASKRPLWIAGIAAFFAAAAWLPLEGALIGGAWRGAIDSTILRALLATSIGGAWVVRAASALLVVAAIAMGRPPRLTATFGALSLASLALTGHANMDEGVRALVHLPNHVLHLLAGSAWLGFLCILPACLRRLGDPSLGAEAQLALRRFSFVGHFTVAIVIGTGVVNTFLILGHLPASLTDPYQGLLIVKIALVGAMTLLALVNRYVIVPRWRDNGRAALRALHTLTICEVVSGFVVLSLVSVFGILDPQ